MTIPPVYSYILTVPHSAIDGYGHVNNVMYVQWMQEAATQHGLSLPGFEMPDHTGWFAREHRIEYLAPAYEGEELEVRTWLVEMRRVRAQRRYEFVRRSDGKLIARGETQWIFVDLATGRPIPIPADMVALFPVVREADPQA